MHGLHGWHDPATASIKYVPVDMHGVPHNDTSSCRIHETVLYMPCAVRLYVSRCHGGTGRICPLTVGLCLIQRLNEEINVSDVIGQDAYRRAVALSRRRTASSRGMSVDGHPAAAIGNGNGSHAASMDAPEAGAAKAAPWEP